MGLLQQIVSEFKGLKFRCFVLRLDTLQSALSALDFLGVLLGCYLVGQLMDSRGRKWSAVTLRGILGVIAPICTVLSYLFDSVELFAVNSFLGGIVSRKLKSYKYLAF